MLKLLSLVALAPLPSPTPVVDSCVAHVTAFAIGECECPESGYDVDIWWNTSSSSPNCGGCVTSWTYTVTDDNNQQTAVGNAHEAADCGDDAGSRHYIKCPCTDENWIVFIASCTDCP